MSNDRTAAVALAHGARVMHHEIRNIAAVRNAGLRDARYPLILSIDADCAMPSDGIQPILNFMATGNSTGGGLGLRVLSNKRSTRFWVYVIQMLVERMSGIRGAVFFFSKAEALAIGGFDETRLVAEDSAFAIKMQKSARAKHKKFGLLKKVEVTTTDRKDTSPKIAAVLAFKLMRAFFGRQPTRDELAYWYDPKR